LNGANIPSRGRQKAGGISRRSWLLASIAVGVSRARGDASPRLDVLWDGDDLRVSVPGLHFLTGKPLERLHDGVSVAFISQLTLATDDWSTVVRRSPERFVFSYDLWEEKFSITKLGTPPRTAAHLSAAAAEAWCVDNVAISTGGLTPERPFWLRLELRAAEPREEAAVIGEPGINLNRLIEMFSRRPRDMYPKWTAEAGPLRLGDLKKLAGRASRS